MKKFLIILFAALIAGSVTSYAAKVYNYGIITSCGEVRYIVSEEEIPGEMLADIAEAWELILCHSGSNNEAKAEL